MEDLERRSREWHERVFGPVEICTTTGKLDEEYRELIEEITDGVGFGQGPYDKEHAAAVINEAGDVIMVLSHIIRHYGGTVEGCWRAAIEKCERRERTGER